jgi:hypothetical protein
VVYEVLFLVNGLLTQFQVFLSCFQRIFSFGNEFFASGEVGFNLIKVCLFLPDYVCLFFQNSFFAFNDFQTQTFFFSEALSFGINAFCLCFRLRLLFCLCLFKFAASGLASAQVVVISQAFFLSRFPRRLLCGKFCFSLFAAHLVNLQFFAASSASFHSSSRA